MTRRIKVLSVSSVFPHPKDREFGLFVKYRLEHLAHFAEVRVVAPVALLDYGDPKRRIWAGLQRPLQGRDGELEIMRPRWLYPPLFDGLNGLFLALRLLPFLARLNRRFAFDILDAHFGHPEGIAVALVATVLRKPYLITLRGNETAKAETSVIRCVMRWALRRASRVITVSDRLREFAVSLGARPQLIKTIPNGIDGRLFFPRDRRMCRDKHNLPATTPVILSAGYLIERKGHHRIIQALHSIGRQPAPLLVVAGGPGREGQFAHDLYRLVDELGMQQRVRFLGRVTPETMAELMSAADLLCLGSSREGWPNVVHEAMGCGTPVVSTDVGGVPAMISSPEYGYVVPVGDERAMEDAIRAALTREWNRESIAAWAHSRSWAHVAREVFEQIETVLRKQSERKSS